MLLTCSTARQTLAKIRSDLDLLQLLRAAKDAEQALEAMQDIEQLVTQLRHDIKMSLVAMDMWSLVILIEDGEYGTRVLDNLVMDLNILLDGSFSIESVRDLQIYYKDGFEPTLTGKMMIQNHPEYAVFEWSNGKLTWHTVV